MAAVFAGEQSEGEQAEIQVARPQDFRPGPATVRDGLAFHAVPIGVKLAIVKIAGITGERYPPLNAFSTAASSRCSASDISKR